MASNRKHPRLYQLNIRLSRRERDDLRRVADRDRRTVSDWLRLRIIDALDIEQKKAVGQ